MQLIATGDEDIRLTGTPDITFWKAVFKRHTHFAMECIENSFNKEATFEKTVSCVIQRNGDLLKSIFLQIWLPELVHGTNTTGGSVNTDGGTAIATWVPSIGHRLIEKVEFIDIKSYLAKMYSL